MLYILFRNSQSINLVSKLLTLTATIISVVVFYVALDLKVKLKDNTNSHLVDEVHVIKDYMVAPLKEV